MKTLLLVAVVTLVAMVSPGTGECLPDEAICDEYGYPPLGKVSFSLCI